MKTAFKDFIADEDGAVTVDWVVITAGIVAFSFAIMLFIQNTMPVALADLLTRATDVVMP